jgi:hypothetical protein
MEVEGEYLVGYSVYTSYKLDMHGSYQCLQCSRHQFLQGTSRYWVMDL